MRWLAKLDEWLIIRIFTPILNFCGKRFGVTTGDLTRHCLVGSLVLQIMALAIDFKLSSCFGFMILVLMGFLFLKEVAQRTDHWPNSNYSKYLHVRCFTLICNCLDLLDFIDPTPRSILLDFSFLSWTCGWYFAACPPAPPKQQKLPKGNLAPNPI